MKKQILAKKHYFLIGFLIVLAIALPLSFVQAFLGEGLARQIGERIIISALTALLGITTGILNFVSVLVAWVISPSFIDLPYTSEGIVSVGFDITKSFANIGFIFGLVVIALATAFRYQDYQAKKALPILIIMALLVNFAPVACGIVVDASNIVMNFFLEEVSNADALYVVAYDAWAKTIAGFQNLTGAVTDSLGLLTEAISLAAFEMFASFFLLLYAVLFIVRYVAIWTLVIMSPLAFFAYVLPFTRHFFSKWLNQFIQWCFVGVPAAFFLYLTEQLIIQSATHISDMPPGSAGNVFSLSQSFSSIFKYTVAIVLLAFGFLASLTGGAIGAGAIIATGKSWGGAAAKWEGGRIAKAGRNLADKAGVTRGIQSLSKQMATVKTPGAGEKGVGGFFKRTGAAILPLNTIRGIGQAGLRLTGGADAANSAAAREAAGKRSVAENLSAYRKSTNETERVGILQAMREKKQLRDVLDENKFGKNILSGAEVLSTYRRAQEMGEKDLIDGLEAAFIGKEYGLARDKKTGELRKMNMEEMFADIVDKRTRNYVEKDRTDGGLTKEESKTFKDYTEKIIAGITSSDDIKNLQKGFWKNENVMETIEKFWGGQQIGEAARTFGRDFIDTFQNGLETKGLEYFAVNNPKVARFVTSNLAQDLGIGIPGWTQNQVKDTVNHAREVRNLNDNDLRVFASRLANETNPTPEMIQNLKLYTHEMGRRAQIASRQEIQTPDQTEQPQRKVQQQQPGQPSGQPPAGPRRRPHQQRGA